MLSKAIEIRIRYGETDAMGVVYYGNYSLYLEEGRTEWLRDIGYTYKGLEDSGIMLPVVQLKIDYKHPAGYDDLIRVTTRLKELPTAKITDRKSTRLNSSHVAISYAVFCLKK